MAFSPVKIGVIELGGGLDLETPPLSVKPGRLLECVNFEPGLNGGYTRVKGFERFDGRTRPSDAIYHTLPVVSTAGYGVNDAITGGTSGATAYIAKVASATVLVITKITGTFASGESIGTTTTTDVSTYNGANTLAEHLDYKAAAAAYYRTLIGTVTGSGNILGCYRHLGKVYAFRANAGGTAVDLFKSTTSGWSQITYPSYIKFDAGTTEFNVGATLTGGTSGATATIKKVILYDGAWDATGKGYLVVTGITGTFQDNEALSDNGSVPGAATEDGTATAVTFATGGRFEFISHNFYGSSTTYNVYGCDGVNPAFEIDQNDIVSPILHPNITGVPSTNTPKFIAAFSGHLFLSFPGGSVQHSALGEPLTWNGFLGASEFGIGSEITGLSAQEGQVLAIYSERKTYGLYGTSTADWNLRPISTKSGGIAYSVQKVGVQLAWEDRGVTRLDRVQAYGDFEQATVSRLIQSRLAAYKGQDSFIGSVVVREKDQYRLYMDDGYYFIGYVPAEGNGQLQWTIGYIDHVPFCLSNGEDENGKECILFGSSDGYVYEMERGTSMDGTAMEFALRPAFAHFGSPAIRKSYFNVEFQIDTPNRAEFQIAAEFGYSAPHTPSFASINNNQAVESDGGGAYWNSSLWSDFAWDAQPVGTAKASIKGTGVNVGILIYGDYTYIESFTLTAMLVHYKMRRLERR